MRFSLLTLFPELVLPWREVGKLRDALQQNLLDLEVIDLKKFSGRDDGRVDDRPYGGGPGMVFRPEVVMEALESIPGHEEALKLHLSPAGERLTQQKVQVFSEAAHVIVLASRYEGVDQRALSLGNFLDVSVGDFVSMGGEAPALMLLESVVRLIPGVLQNDDSAREDSFSDRLEGRLEGPVYTRPQEYRGLKVPEVLTTGDHAQIRQFRHDTSCRRTRERRPDLS